MKKTKSERLRCLRTGRFIAKLTCEYCNIPPTPAYQNREWCEIMIKKDEAIKEVITE